MKKKLFPTRIRIKSRKRKNNKRAKTFFIRQHMKINKKLNFEPKKTVLDIPFNEDRPQVSSSNENNEMNSENERGFITELCLFVN